MSASPSSSARLAPGQIVAGKYRVLGPLGEGGMGVVVRACQLMPVREVALKVLSAERLGRPGASARLLREAQAMARLQSEHTVRLLDAGMLDDGSPYLAMELLEGCDLGQRLRTHGAQPIEDAVSWVIASCEALAEAHAQGIVHRDLKPSNLFLARQRDDSSRLKVLDFGLARLPEDHDRGLLTRSDSMLGSPSYMAPEQIRSARRVDAQCDVWALGVVLHQLVSNALPFEADSSPGLLAAIVADEPTPLRAHLGAAPEPLEAIVQRCLRKSPSDRFAGVAALARALAPLAPPTAGAQVERIERIAQLASSPASLVSDAAPDAEPTPTPLSASWPGASTPDDPPLTALTVTTTAEAPVAPSVLLAPDAPDVVAATPAPSRPRHHEKSGPEVPDVLTLVTPLETRPRVWRWPGALLVLLALGAVGGRLWPDPRAAASSSVHEARWSQDSSSPLAPLATSAPANAEPLLAPPPAKHESAPARAAVSTAAASPATSEARPDPSTVGPRSKVTSAPRTGTAPGKPAARARPTSAIDDPETSY